MKVNSQSMYRQYQQLGFDFARVIRNAASLLNERELYSRSTLETRNNITATFSELRRIVDTYAVRIEDIDNLAASSQKSIRV